MSAHGSRPVRVVIVGAGISGLAAAWQLTHQAPAIEVLVLEAAPIAGGKLQGAEVGGTEVDVGAEALLARRPEGVDLIRAVGLEGMLVRPLSLSAHVRAGGANKPLPARTMLGIPGDIATVRASGVLSPGALSTLTAESALPPLPPLDSDVSVGSLVRRRLADEVVDRLVDPLLGGVYAGIADDLSLAATMPALWAKLSRDGGSLMAAASAVTAPPPSGNSSSSGTDGTDGTDDPVFVSLAGGLSQLADALARSPLFEVRTKVTVRAIRRAATGFVVDCGAAAHFGDTAQSASASHQIDADAVVVAVPASKAALLLSELTPFAAAELAGIETASMAIVTLAFDRVTFPSGSGLLVGSKEGFAVKAITLSSQKWPLSSSRLSLLRASVGRAGDTHELQREDSDLVMLVRRELSELIGVRAAPVDDLVTRWGGGLPQYGVGHVDRVRRIRASIAEVPGLAVCGASYDGLGIPACIASASSAVSAIMDGWSKAGERANSMT